MRPRLGPRLCRWTLIKSGSSNRSAKIFVQILKLCFWSFYLFFFLLFVCFILFFFCGRGCRWAAAAASVAFISHAERSRHHETLFKTQDSSPGLYRAQFISQVFHVRGLKLKPRRDVGGFPARQTVQHQHRVSCEPSAWLGICDFSSRPATRPPPPRQQSHKKANL